MMSHGYQWYRKEKPKSTIAFYKADSRVTGKTEELHLLRGGDEGKIACVVGVMERGSPTIICRF
jgi:hypothetical protein